MEVRSGNQELAYANILFSRLFRNIVIERQINGEKREVQVNCVIGNRSRIFKDLENPDKAATYKLPLIVITRTGYQINNSRLANLHNEVLHAPTTSSHIYDIMTPVPIDVSYTVTVLSKYPGDNDLICSNFIPFFNSDLFVTTTHPKFTDVKIDCQIVMGNSISEQLPEELASNADNFTTTTFNFTFKTWLYAGMNKVPITDVYTRYITSTIVSTWIDDDGNEQSALVSTVISTDYSGFVPIIKKIWLEMHAVPYMDPLKQRPYFTDLSQLSMFIVNNASRLSNLAWPSISGDELCDRISSLTQPSTLESIYNAISSREDLYSNEKYFEDLKNGLIHNPQYDEIHWAIDDESGEFNVDSAAWGRL